MQCPVSRAAQPHLPSQDAAAFASAPSYKLVRPRADTFLRRSPSAPPPTTWRAVFSVSRGVSNSRQPAPAVDANAVATGTGTPGAVMANSASTPVLAAVSPKRDSGACAAQSPLSAACAYAKFKCVLPHLHKRQRHALI